MVKSFIPKTYEEALDILSSCRPIIFAGGTDLMVKRRSWAGLAPGFSKEVLFVSQLKELDYIYKENGKIRIGATVTLEKLLTDDKIPGLLKKALRLMASPGIRHTATLAGNIGNASPAGDSLPVLYILNTEIVLGNKTGNRSVPIEQFINGPGQIDLRDGEMIKEILFDDADFDFTMYEKVGGRKSDAISKVSFVGAVSSVFDMVTDIRISFGAVAPEIVRDRSLESRLKGTPVRELLRMTDLVLEQYEQHIRPISDQRSNSEYRKKCAFNLLSKFFKEAERSYR